MSATGSVRLPDFVIGGAMKSGTTSIHHLLRAHPRVFIPDRELFFFDADDVMQHPQLLRKGYSLPDYHGEFDRLLRAYEAWFAGAGGDRLVGEDTTTYLASERAPERMAELLPAVKLVFVLRDPVDRAYSHYWHMVRHGLAFFDFDATLEHMPGTIIQRGLYKRQLDRFLVNFPREQVHVTIFEDFCSAPQPALDELSAFLGLEPAVRVPPGEGSRYNAATAVRHPRLYRNANLLLRVSLGRSPAVQTPATATPAVPGGGRAGSRARSLLFDSQASYPPLDPRTRERLGRFYARENSGLSELVDRDLSTLWPLSKP